MSFDFDNVLERTCHAVKRACDEPLEIAPDQSFVGDLGFDSLRMASLALTLEEEFGSTLLLNDWIARSDDPERLNVVSLAQYVHRQLGRGEKER